LRWIERLVWGPVSGRNIDDYQVKQAQQQQLRPMQLRAMVVVDFWGRGDRKQFSRSLEIDNRPWTPTAVPRLI
jgi:hypothetical protein